jgi:hypothetical protein
MTDHDRRPARPRRAISGVLKAEQDQSLKAGFDKALAAVKERTLDKASGGGADNGLTLDTLRECVEQARRSLNEAALDVAKEQVLENGGCQDWLTFRHVTRIADRALKYGVPTDIAQVATDEQLQEARVYAAAVLGGTTRQQWSGPTGGSRSRSRSCNPANCGTGVR